MITKFSRPLVRELSEQLESELKGFGDDRGIDIRVEAASFSPAEAVVKFHITAQQLQSGLDPRHIILYNEKREKHLLPPLNAIIRDSDGFDYEVMGWHGRATRYPVKVIRLSDKKIWHFSTNYVNGCTVVEEK